MQSPNRTLTAKLAFAAIVLAVQFSVGAEVFNIRQFGAGSGAKPDTTAIQAAIDAAAAAGGGNVLFPPGAYLSGSIFLKSHVHLVMQKGATLRGSPQQTDYAKLNFHGLLLADQQEDIGVSGEGVIDGQGVALAADTERRWNEGKLPNAREGERPVIINFRGCRKVAMRDITLRQSACWVQEYRDCDDLTIEHLTVRSMATINNDGIDIDGCRHVVVRGCDIDSEDDGICLKSDDRACEDVLVENCRVRSTCNALKFGTRSATGFKDITCRNLTLYDTYISAIALEIVDGGVMENVSLSHIKITDCNNPIFIRLGHRNTNGPVGTFRNVMLSDITAVIPNRSLRDMNKFPPNWHHRCRTLVTGSITGLPGNPVQGVTLKNISIIYGGIGNTAAKDQLSWENLDRIPECAGNYPESTMFGILPAWGLFVRHAEGIRLENITLRTLAADNRPALICDDAKDIRLDNLQVKSANAAPVIVLRNVDDVMLTNTVAPPHAVVFIKTLGNTRNVQQP